MVGDPIVPALTLGANEAQNQLSDIDQIQNGKMAQLPPSF